MRPGNEHDLVARDQLIAELEALNTEREERLLQQYFRMKRLQEENAALRRMASSTPQVKSDPSIKTAFAKLELLNQIQQVKIAELEKVISEHVAATGAEGKIIETLKAELQAVREDRSKAGTLTVKSSQMQKAQTTIERQAEKLKILDEYLAGLRDSLSKSMICGNLMLGSVKKFVLVSEKSISIYSEDLMKIERRIGNGSLTMITKIKGKGFQIRFGEKENVEFIFNDGNIKAKVDLWLDVMSRAGFQVN